jgi:hypothetical protein
MTVIYAQFWVVSYSCVAISEIFFPRKSAVLVFGHGAN